MKNTFVIRIGLVLLLVAGTVPTITMAVFDPSQPSGQQEPDVAPGTSQDQAAYTFPPVNSLPDQVMMPDPFLKPDGARVATRAEWPAQRAYLKAMLEHYLYGTIPPKPTSSELSFVRLSDEAYSPPGSSIAGRKQGYRITITRNGRQHSFTFNLWRPAGAGRYPTLINNHPEHNDYISMGNPAALRLTGSMTLSAWIRGDVLSGTQVIVSKRGSSSDQGWAIRSNSVGLIEFIVATSASGYASRKSTSTLSANTWYHVVGVYNASAQTMDVYINGFLNNGAVTANIPTAQRNSGQNVNIARNPTNNQFWNGAIDDVRVYNRALSAADIVALP